MASIVLIIIGVVLHAVAGYFQFWRLNRYGVEEFSTYWGLLGKKSIEWLVKTIGTICCGLGLITGMLSLCTGP